MRIGLAASITFVSLLTPVAAQRLAAYGPTSAGIVELQPPTFMLQAVPAANPPLFGYSTLPVLPAMPSFGDSTFDNVLGYHWFTEGVTLAAMPTPSFPPLGPVPGAFPISPGVLAITGGPVTGIALDPVANVMFLCGPVGSIVGVTPVPGMPVVVPPFPIPWPTGPIAGLEWDAVNGTVLAVDLFGIVYEMLPGGVGFAPPWAPAIPLPGPAGDIAIDRTLRLNPWGMRPLYVVAGFTVFDVREQVPVVFSAGVLSGEGLAFVNHPAASVPIGSCLCTGTTYPGPLFTTGPMTFGNATFGVGHGGLPPGFPMLFLFDLANNNPNYPWINSVGCGLGLIPGSPAMIVMSALADGAGRAILPLPLLPPTMPLGMPMYLQNLTLCGADAALGLVFSPMHTLYVAGS